MDWDVELEIIKITSEQFGELVFACEQSSYELSFYFDKQTGEVEMLGDYVDVDPELKERIEDDIEERYIGVPQIESSEAFGDMVDFTETVQDERMQDLLARALSGGKGVFRRFKDTLSEDRKLLEQWYQFKDQRNRERVLEYFEVNENIKLVIE